MARRRPPPEEAVVPDFPPMLYVRLVRDPSGDQGPLYVIEDTVEAAVGALPSTPIGYYQWVRTVKAIRYVQVSTLPPPPTVEILEQAKQNAASIIRQARITADRVAAERRHRKALRQEQRAPTARPRRRRARLASDDA